jgi:hypothetical protein
MTTSVGAFSAGRPIAAPSRIRLDAEGSEHAAGGLDRRGLVVAGPYPAAAGRQDAHDAVDQEI